MQAEHGVSFQLRLLHNAIKRRITTVSPPPPCATTTHLHGMIIGFLAEHEGQDLFQKDVEYEFHIRRSTASTVLKLMEKNGLIRRESVPQDARLKRLILTDQAWDLHTKMDGRLQMLDELLIRGITPEDLAGFNRAIQQMQKNMEMPVASNPINGGKS